MADSPLALTDAVVRPDWGGLFAYPPYSLPIATPSDPAVALADVTDLSDDTYAQISWGAGVAANIDTYPPDDFDVDASYRSGWAGMPDSSAGGQFDFGRGYRMDLRLSDVPAGVDTFYANIRVAFSQSGPTPVAPDGYPPNELGLYWSNNVSFEGQDSGGYFITVPVNLDDAFHTYSYSVQGVAAASNPQAGLAIGSLYLDDGVEWSVTARISRIWYSYTLQTVADESIDGQIGDTRRVFYKRRRR